MNTLSFSDLLIALNPILNSSIPQKPKTKQNIGLNRGGWSLWQVH